MTPFLTATDEIHQLLFLYIGDDTDVEGHEAPLCDGAVVFYNDMGPNADFKGFDGLLMLEANLTLSENDDDKKHRLERVGAFLLYTRAEGDTAGVTHVTGQALECEQGSTLEKQFVDGVLLDMAGAASEPLAAVVEAARESGIRLGDGFKQKLLTMLNLS